MSICADTDVNEVLFKAAQTHTAKQHRPLQEDTKGMYWALWRARFTWWWNPLSHSSPLCGQASRADSDHQSSSISRPSGHLRFSPRSCWTLLYSIPVRFSLFSPCWLSGSRLCFSHSTTLLLYLLQTRCFLKSQPGKWPGRCHQFRVSGEIDFVVNEASVLLSQGVTDQFVIIAPLCRSHAEQGGYTTATIWIQISPKTVYYFCQCFPEFTYE